MTQRTLRVTKQKEGGKSGAGGTETQVTHFKTAVSRLHNHFLMMHFWGCHLIHLCLGFLIGQMGLTTLSTP